MSDAWYMDDSAEDQRLEHKFTPSVPVSLEELKRKTGVLYWKLNADTFQEDGTLDKIRKDRGYTYEDLIEIEKGKLAGYEEKLKIFFQEHLHADEEIRFFVGGSGYFDVRDCDDKWIRIKCLKDDLLILPAGIYHRFTLDENNYAKVVRLFPGEPVWTAHNRPADDMAVRKQYLQSLAACS